MLNLLGLSGIEMKMINKFFARQDNNGFVKFTIEADPNDKFVSLQSQRDKYYPILIFIIPIIFLALALNFIIKAPI